MTAKTNGRTDSSIQLTTTLTSAFRSLPDLSRYNNPMTARADLLRGVKCGRLAAAGMARSPRWDFDDETEALDLAIESVPLSESMSLAFLQGFAAEFRHAYQKRFQAA